MFMQNLFGISIKDIHLLERFFFDNLLKINSLSLCHLCTIWAEVSSLINNILLI
jgi:hypothetical protein